MWLPGEETGYGGVIWTLFYRYVYIVLPIINGKIAANTKEGTLYLSIIMLNNIIRHILDRKVGYAWQVTPIPAGLAWCPKQKT